MFSMRFSGEGAWVPRIGDWLCHGLATGWVPRTWHPALVPTSLLDATIKAASVGQAAAVSAKVAALTEGVLTAMFLSKVKGAMALLLAGVVLVCGSGLFE